MISPNSTYTPALDHIRALAATLVVFQHSHARIGGRLAFGQGGELYGAQAATPFDAVLIEGHTGVSLFMVLSGFIFTHIANGSKIQYGRFVLNRILRIYPLMLAVFAAGLIVWWRSVTGVGILAVILIPFQVKPFFWHVPELYPFTTLFWAISSEFQFYLVFPMLLLFLHRGGLGAMLLLLVTAIGVRLSLAMLGFDHVQLSYFTIAGRMDQFLIGIIAAAIYRHLRNDDLHQWLVLASISAIVLLFAFNRSGGLTNTEPWRLFWPTVEGVTWAAFIIGYLNVAQHMHAGFSRAIALVGEVSFSIYLLHLVVIAAILRLQLGSFGLNHGLASLLYGAFLVFPITFALSLISYRLIERPFLALRVRYLTQSAPSAKASGNSRTLGEAERSRPAALPRHLE